MPKRKKNHRTLPFVVPINMSHNPQLAAMTLCLTSGPAHCPHHCDVISAPWRLTFAGGDNRALDECTGRGTRGGSRRGRCGLPDILFCICTDSRVGSRGGDFQTFYPDVWAGVSATYPLWCIPKMRKIDP